MYRGDRDSGESYWSDKLYHLKLYQVHLHNLAAGGNLMHHFSFFPADRHCLYIGRCISGSWIILIYYCCHIYKKSCLPCEGDNLVVLTLYLTASEIYSLSRRAPLKLEKIWFFGVKSWFFTRNTRKIFAPPFVRPNFFKCASPNLQSWIRPCSGYTDNVPLIKNIA